MLEKKYYRVLTIVTLTIFILFTLTLEYSFAQDENPLLKAQGLYKQGNFIEAVKVLEAFIENVKGNKDENKRLAEANLLLARIYFDAGEDAQVTEYMKQAVEANADIGKEEGNLDFKQRLEQARDEKIKSQTVKEETAPVVRKETVKTEVARPSVQEKEKSAPKIKKKKKFPWLLAIAGAVVVGVLVYFLVIKKPKYNLTVNIGAGATGAPAASAKYKKGTVVNYNYTAQAGYSSLQVNLDGAVVPASGTVTMNSNHTLDVSATQQYTLTVSLGDGTTGTPSSSGSYAQGSVVNYSYSLQSGYQTIVVQLDGSTVSASGSVTMNSNHNLTVSATKLQNHNLIAWWKLNEGSGNTVYDSSGNNHTGQLSGGASWNSGGGIKLNGGKSSVIFEDSAFQLTEGSWEIVVNIPSSTEGVIMEKDNFNYHEDGRLLTYNGKIQFDLQGLQLSQDIVLEGFVSINTDVRIVAEWGTRGMKLFINDVLVATNPSTNRIISSGRPLTLGTSLTGSSANSFYGVIKEVKVYNTYIN